MIFRRRRLPRKPAPNQLCLWFILSPDPIYLAAVVAHERATSPRRPVTPLYKQRLGGERPGRSVLLRRSD